jgi:hypothetical protein
LAAALLPLAPAAFAQESGDLAKTAQNPVAAMISLPFQNLRHQIQARRQA